MLDNKRGNTVLNDLFAWIVCNTKQNHQFHVVTASSDSFYHRWLARYVNEVCFQNFVIGHLTKEEAKKFWEQEAVKGPVINASPVIFEDAYKVCGGCMHLLAETYHIFNVTRGIVRPNGMSFVSHRRYKLYRGLNVSSHWTRKDAREAMSQLIEAKYNYVSYLDLCGKLSHEVVDLMIADKIFYLRPCQSFTFDFKTVAYSEYPIVTPYLPCDIMVMREVLKM